MYDRHLVRLALIHSLPLIAERHGVQLDLLLSRGGVGRDIDWGQSIVTRAQVCAIMHCLARMSGDATIGFQVAAQIDAQRLGPVGTSLSVGRNLRDGLSIQRQHMPKLQQGVQISLTDVGAQAHWVHRLVDSDPERSRYLSEGIAAFVVNCIRTMAGSPEARIHVNLPHRPMVPLRQYEEFLRCAVSFVPGTDLVVRFDSSLLDRPNAIKTPQASMTRESSATDAVLSDTPLAGDDLLRGLSRMIEVAALMDRLSIQEASSTLGIAPRSLQRRLAFLGTSFEGQVESWRHGKAITLLCDAAERTDSIAQQLGYADPSHFIRAFHRWEGMSPSRFRAERGMTDAAPFP